MKLELHLAKDFGPHLADGAEAVTYRVARIDPYLDLCDQIVFNFSGVRNANSSFVNGLITGAIEQRGESAVRKFAFKGCNPILQVLVSSAVTLGIEKARELPR